MLGLKLPLYDKTVGQDKQKLRNEWSKKTFQAKGLLQRIVLPCDLGWKWDHVQ